MHYPQRVSSMTVSSILKRQCSKDMRLTLHHVGLGCLLDQSREVWTMAQRRLWSEVQYKAAISQFRSTDTLQSIMRTSLLFLALAVANGATVAFSTVLRGTRYTSTSYSNSLSDYLGKLTPVAKDVLVNRIAGPAIGADVNLHAPFPDALRY